MSLSEQLNFHFHHHLPHMRQDHSSLRGDKECNDDICLVKVLRKHPGNQWCCHSHITNMNFQKPHGKEIGFGITGATQIAKHSHHGESYLTNRQTEF